jgi:predicted DNA-binding transcriptional regulator AlpA
MAYEPRTLLRLGIVSERTGMGERTIWRMVRLGDFPAPVRVATPKMTAWRSDEVQDWINRVSA